MAGVFCAAICLVALLQWKAGSYDAEFADNSDEATHYVTGLMVHDYLVRGFPAPPLRFAQDFYSHYPKVGLGHWPPVFYAAQALWMFVFGEGRASALWLMAVISALVLTVTHRLASAYFGFWVAAGVTLFLATTRWFQQFSRTVMTDMLATLLMLLSLIALSRHLNRNEWRTGFLFGGLAAMALLTKPTTIALAPLPLLAALLLRREHNLRTWPFWSPALLALALALPWFAAAPDALHGSVGFLGGLRFRWYRPLESIYHWAKVLGPAAAGLAAIGLARTAGLLWAVRREAPEAPRRDRAPGALWACLLLTIPVVIAFRCFVGAWQPPYLVATLPILALFCCSGVAWLARLAPAAWIRAPLAILLLVTAIAGNLRALPPKPHRGLDLAAAAILEDPGLARAPLLIVSDAAGEGAFIAEVASRARRPERRVLRGSKVLADSDWMGAGYRLRFESPVHLMEFVGAQPGLVLVLDSPAEAAPHLAQVRAALASCPHRWQTLHTVAWSPPRTARIDIVRARGEGGCE
ncbi:MAG: glycosyltransferase family 39 protein [Bryobacteraceae bacterium]|nr:glycosyltransferase family 39 protein [Bryobacteraceae bacterium]